MSLKKKPFLFVAFEKIEKQEDGTLLVSGVASSEAVDSDGETITSDAMKAALPDYMKFGAVREMHQPIAAGTALKCEVGQDGRTTIEAKIVDASTVMKIEEEVLKGFSVGGRVTSRDPLNKNTITGIKLTEISVVDRPANPEALFVLGKVEGADEPTLGVLRKGMYDVERLADLLFSLAWLTWNVQSEAECEGDGSPVPAALADAVRQLGEALKTMTTEEVDELMAMLPAAPSIEVFQMAAKLAKGEKPSTTLEDIRKVFAEASERLVKLAPAEEVTEKMTKLEAEKDEALAKVGQMEEDLKKAQATIATLTKQVAELEALPALPKGVITVSKGQDITPDPEGEVLLNKQVEEIAKLPPEQQAVALIKVIHANHPGGK